MIRKKTSNYSAQIILNEAHGVHLFGILSENVMELNIWRRQKDDFKFIKILDDLQKGDPKDETIELLKKLKLSNLSSKKQNEVKKIATYIFATKEKRIYIIDRSWRKYVL